MHLSNIGDNKGDNGHMKKRQPDKNMLNEKLSESMEDILAMESIATTRFQCNKRKLFP